MRVSEFSNYVVAGVDVQSGEQIIFLDGGTTREFEGKARIQFKVQLPSGKAKLLTLNQTSLNALAKVYGDETTDWVGKSATVTISDQNVRGQMKKVIYLNP
jgi:hypothetical protein